MDLAPAEAPVQRQTGGAAGQAEQASAAPSRGGQALPGHVQTKMESALGADFSAVRVHEGAHASALNALGYTQGTDIHFAPGQYQPDSQHGQELLGHELAHVVQQGEGRVAATTQFKGIDGNDDAGLEREADDWGARAARGELVSRSGGAQRGAPAIQRKVVQRSPQTSHFGRFLDTEYSERARGVTVKLEFEPGVEVDASKIGMTQSYKVSHNGSPIPFDSQRAARQVPSGPGAGYEHDRVAGRNNPIYGADQLGPGQGLSNTPENNTPSGEPMDFGVNTTYELGHRSPSADGGTPKNARIYDRPGRAPAPGTAMEFETTALAIEGSQQGTYYGSVKWGWHVDASGNLTKDPFALVSQGAPSQNFLAAAAQWSSVTAGGTLKARNSPTQVYSRSGASFAPSFTIARNTVVVSNGMTSIPTSPTSYMNITVQGGPQNGRSGFVPAGDLVDHGDGPATVDLPVSDVRTLNTVQTLNDGVPGPWRDFMTLPVGTRAVPEPGNRPGAAVPPTKVWVRVVDGPDTGVNGYVDQVALTDERP